MSIKGPNQTVIPCSPLINEMRKVKKVRLDLMKREQLRTVVSERRQGNQHVSDVIIHHNQSWHPEQEGESWRIEPLLAGVVHRQVSGAAVAVARRPQLLIRRCNSARACTITPDQWHHQAISSTYRNTMSPCSVADQQETFVLCTCTGVYRRISVSIDGWILEGLTCAWCSGLRWCCGRRCRWRECQCRWSRPDVRRWPSWCWSLHCLQERHTNRSSKAHGAAWRVMCTEVWATKHGRSKCSEIQSDSLLSFHKVWISWSNVHVALLVKEKQRTHKLLPVCVWWRLISLLACCFNWTIFEMFAEPHQKHIFFSHLCMYVNLHP